MNPYHIQIPLPIDYVESEPQAYIYKSLGLIVEDQVEDELVELQLWFTDQIFDAIGWGEGETITMAVVGRAIAFMASNDIKPKTFMYINEDDTNETNM